MADTCKNCAFFDWSEQAQQGCCRQHSPVLVSSYGNAHWPEVKQSDWCGDHAHRRGYPHLGRDDVTKHK